jgi:hypothetical protein
MNRKEKIEKEVQKTLEGFSHVVRLNGDSFFYTRLKNRIDNSSRQKRKILGWEFAWGVLNPILLSLIIVLNIFSATLFIKYQSSDYSNHELQLDSFVRELALDSNQYNPNFLINEQE